MIPPANMKPRRNKFFEGYKALIGTTSGVLLQTQGLCVQAQRRQIPINMKYSILDSNLIFIISRN